MPPLHAKGVEQRHSRRSPGYASFDLRRGIRGVPSHLATVAGPEVSQTVARQRRIRTCFPRSTHECKFESTFERGECQWMEFSCEENDEADGFGLKHRALLPMNDS